MTIYDMPHLPPSTPDPAPAPTLDKTHCAVFRVVSLEVQRANPEDMGTPGHGVIQERLILPLNSIMGRSQLGQAGAGLGLHAPGVAHSNFFVKKLDFFDNKFCSKLHCFIEVDEYNQVRIRDNSSTNGTWLLSRDQNWVRLEPGSSHALEIQQKIRLGGANSQYEYEYLGLSPHAHIRVRYCSKSNDTLIQGHHWEWMRIPMNGTVWSTRNLQSIDGLALHGGPHFDVQITRAEDGTLRASVGYDAIPNRVPRTFLQKRGSTVYGAELEGHDEDGDSEIYQVGYELLLPGEVEDAITPILGAPIEHTRRYFLRSSSLRFHAQIDEEGWTTQARIDFANLDPIGVFSTNIKFYRVHQNTPPKEERLTRAEVVEDGFYSSTPKTIRQAMTCALIERRLRDQRHQEQEPGWVTPEEIVGLTEFRTLDNAKFLRSFKKWRSDLRDQLSNRAIEIQRGLPKYISIPAEQDWLDFVELVDEQDALKIRLHPEIRVEATRVRTLPISTQLEEG